MPNTVPAADEGLPTINRRSALAKLGLGLAASTSLAATAIAAPDAGVSPELLRAHKAAYDAADKAMDAQDEAHKIYAAQPIEPPKGFRKEELLPINSTNEMDARFETLENRLQVGAALFGTALDFDSLPPRLSKRARQLVGDIASEKGRTLKEFFKAQEAVKEASGYAAAKRTQFAASEAESAAMLVLCSYRCRTPAEGRARASYISSDRLGVGALSERHIEALLQSACVEA